MLRFYIGSVRVLFLALDLRPEVDEAESIHAREVARALTEQGHVVTFAVSKHALRDPTLGSEGPVIEPVGGGSSLREFVRVWRLARRFRPDVVYERRFVPKVSAILSGLLGVPSVVEINGIAPEEAEILGTGRPSILPATARTRLYSLLFRRMVRVVTVTHGLAQDMVRLYRVPPSKIAVVENGANTRIFRPLDKTQCRQKIGIDPKGEWLIFEGGLAPWHGVDTLLRSVEILAGSRPSLRLAVVGDGPGRAGLESLARELGVQDRVRFFGRVPYQTVPLYIGACDIGVCPFTRERNERIGSSPMKVYEYVACGRPVVVSNLPGMGDWVRMGGLGRVVEPDNPRALASAIEDALSDSRLAGEMAERGPSVVRTDHSWTAVATKLGTLFRAVAQGDSASA